MSDFRRIVRDRREGRVHSADDLGTLARGAADGSLGDDVLSAWLMAACLCPLSPGETADLTLAMARSGETLDLSAIPRPWVDKHSTGGVGDKTTLVLLPLLAACGLTMVKMSGRGLGITGGTVDKLESIPGFRTDLAPEEMLAQAGRIGLALSGQTPRLAPADGRLYALRDATATVDSLPLIVASILSKKIAGGAETVVLDVKCGSGAFMPDLAAARELAAALTEVGTRAGLTVRTAITDMDVPLGGACGNAIEVAEAFAVLRGESVSPAVARFRELCVRLADLALEAVGRPPEAADRLADGSAWAKAIAWVAAQGGDAERFRPEPAPVVRTVVAPESGTIARIDAREVGEAVVALGGGRRRKGDRVDPRVGVTLLRTVGEWVERGEPILEIRAASDDVPPIPITLGPSPTRPALLE